MYKLMNSYLHARSIILILAGLPGLAWQGSGTDPAQILAGPGRARELSFVRGVKISD